MSKEFTQPAFPVPGLQHDEDFSGMSLRDYFAAKAMQAVISNSSSLDRMHLAAMSVDAEQEDLVARAAYDMADAMLRARSA